MKRERPILHAILWATVGAITATVLVFTFQAFSAQSPKSDVELDREAAEGAQR